MNAILIALSLNLFNSDFSICNVNNNQQWPSAIYQNNQYYVFWEDERSTPRYSLYGARVSASGTVIDANGKMFYQDSVYLRPAIAYDGTNFLVAFRNHC